MTASLTRNRNRERHRRRNRMQGMLTLPAYYNENDPYAAQWLRNLIEAGLIAPGDVDERSIVDVRADDLAGYTQCHFFAGIGGWSDALRIACWPDDEPCWTGSCPCQPLSIGGQRKGHADQRHLWPAFYSLIAECSPPIIFGEQVASADGLEWLAAVRSDLEHIGYACGASNLCAAGAGAPHPRQRLYFVGKCGWADTNSSNGIGWHCAVQVGREPHAGAIAPASPLHRDQWRLEPRPSPLADGVQARMEQCCAYGNAIVPQVAAEFIKAATEAINA